MVKFATWQIVKEIRLTKLGQHFCALSATVLNLKHERLVLFFEINDLHSSCPKIYSNKTLNKIFKYEEAKMLKDFQRYSNMWKQIY